MQPRTPCATAVNNPECTGSTAVNHPEYTGPHSAARARSYKIGTISALKDLDHRVGIHHTDHTDHTDHDLSEV